jgi:phosphatidylserine decarboxylase
MTVRSLFAAMLQQEDVNFLLTNRIPRRLATRFVGWFSRIEQPLVRRLSIGAFRLFADVDLSDAKRERFRSLHDCFTRELRDGARPVDADRAVLVSPCDGIVGASGRIEDTMLIQAKGFSYALEELLVDPAAAARYRCGCYVTLRLTAGMYHRFHAPYDCRVEQVVHVWGDAWNVNPIALKRVERLYCRNERALLGTRLAVTGHVVTLVPVAAILVAGIRLHFVDVLRHPGRRTPAVISCDVPFRKGEEMGWFEHGSTIIVLAPDGLELATDVRSGSVIRMGQPLMRLPQAAAGSAA